MTDALPPAGLSWAEYVESWVAERGGWLPLADALIHAARGRFEVPDDPQTIERGLRRLSRRAHKPGGQYGRWMLKLFGVTSSIEQWVRWLGSYHSRFADLPSGLRLEQLAQWNRPPLTESRVACWIHIGIALAHDSRGDRAAREHWLALAEKGAPNAGPAAEIEVALVRAELATRADDRSAIEAAAHAIDRRLAAAALPDLEALPYRARIEALRAVRFTKPPAGELPDLVRARACYSAIPESSIPFVAFRRCLGLAYCAWKAGDRDEAVRLAQRASDEAGDGGLVRMRVMALNLLSRITEAEAVRERARRLAAAVEDEELLRRVALPV